MPQPRMIDLNPKIRQEPTGLEHVLTGFANKFREDMVEGQDIDQLKQIYGQYQEGRKSVDAIQDVQQRRQAEANLLDQRLQQVSTSKLSPTAKVNEVNRILEFRKQNTELQKEDLKQVRLQQKAEREAQQKKADKEEEAGRKKEENEQEVSALVDLLDRDPATKEQLKKNLTPTSARTLLMEQGKTQGRDYDIAANVAKRFEPELKEFSTKSQSSKSILPNLDTAILNNEKYTFGEKLWDNVLDATQSPFLSMFKSKTGQELETIAPIAISSFGQKMGGVLTNQKLNLLSKKTVGLGKDKDANRMILYMDKYDKTLDVLKNRFANQIIADNKYGLAQADFERKLEERLYPYQKMISSDIDDLLNNKIPKSPMSHNAVGRTEKLYKMQSPEGETFEIPYDMIEEAIDDDLQYVGG